MYTNAELSITRLVALESANTQAHRLVGLIQLARTPKSLPVMKINSLVTELFNYTFDDFTLEGYEADASIDTPIAI